MLLKIAKFFPKYPSTTSPRKLQKPILSKHETAETFTLITNFIKSFHFNFINLKVILRLILTNTIHFNKLKLLGDKLAAQNLKLF